MVESQFSKLKVVRRRELSSRPAEVNSAGPHPQVLGPRPQNARRGVRTAQTETNRRGMLRHHQGFDLAVGSPAASRPCARSLFKFAGVTQLVESQFSKLKVDGSSPFSRSNLSSRFFSRLYARVAASALEQLAASTLKPTRPASLVAGEASASTGAQRTPVREHRSGAEAQPPAKIAGRRRNRNNVTTEIAHLAQMVEHVLGKDEVTSSILVVGSNRVQLQ